MEKLAGNTTSAAGWCGRNGNNCRDNYHFIRVPNGGASTSSNAGSTGGSNKTMPVLVVVAVGIPFRWFWREMVALAVIRYDTDLQCRCRFHRAVLVAMVVRELWCVFKFKGKRWHWWFSYGGGGGGGGAKIIVNWCRWWRWWRWLLQDRMGLVLSQHNWKGSTTKWQMV